NLDEETRSRWEHPPTSPRLETYESYFQFSVPLPPRTGADGTRLDFIVGKQWLLTIRDCDIPFLAAFREQDRGESMKGKLTPAALAASLMDWHLETFQVELSEIQKAVDKIDTEILEERERRPPLTILAAMRARVSKLRATLGEHRAIIHGLLRPDFDWLADSPEVVYFKALESHFHRAEDGVERARETVIGSFELYATRTAQDTNQLVRALTIVTVVIGMAGAIAGIFGMNFDTPIAHAGSRGFVIVTVAILVLAVVTLVVARLRKWM
ncbi:MAG: CorA family divalent cation transporter, partial [Gemmatimonadaceae bacterium]